MGLPASVRSWALTWSRTYTWSSSGIPSSALMTFIGICAPRSVTKSKRPVPTIGSSAWTQNSRIIGSSALILRGVNMRESSLRCTSWIGGSSKISMPDGMSRLALINSRIAPLAELNVPLSTSALLTSANRLTA